ncbi:MAG: hypothetical protein M3381_03035 [Actinomycetota bacterium]|nr:hypothetical protein [Actinomycetota bacterium]MDQ3715004.1 hypothetical protein [Actinomycetota bacterium]
MVRLSELPDLLGRRPTRSELTHQLVDLDRVYTAAAPDLPWEQFYAGRIVAQSA